MSGYPKGRLSIKRKRLPEDYGRRGAAGKRVRKVGPSQFRPGRDRVGGYYGRYGKSGELKFFDIDVDDAVIAAGGVVTDSINTIAQGVTEVTRVGRKCTIKSINWHYQLNLPQVDAAGTPGNPDNIRMMIYVDKQCNGATAAVLDILETADWQSFRNLSNTGRFDILYDKWHVLNYAGLASDGAGVVSQAKYQEWSTFYKKCNIPLEFDNTTGAITEIRSNNIGVLVVGQSGLAGFSSKFRLRFSDN